MVYNFLNKNPALHLIIIGKFAFEQLLTALKQNFGGHTFKDARDYVNTGRLRRFSAPCSYSGEFYNIYVNQQDTQYFMIKFIHNI